MALHAHYKRIAAHEVRLRSAALAAEAAAEAEGDVEGEVAAAAEALLKDPRMRDGRLRTHERAESPAALLARRQRGVGKEEGALVPRGLDLPALFVGGEGGAEISGSREHVELDKSNVLMVGLVQGWF